MKKLSRLLAVLLILLSLGSCGAKAPAQSGHTVLATTYPMYFLCERLLAGAEDVTVEVLVQEPVSCVHDYTLTTTQMAAIERAELIVLNGSGLEHFMETALGQVPAERIVDTGRDLQAEDPHTWLNVGSYIHQGNQLLTALDAKYPQHHNLLTANYETLQKELTELYETLSASLSDLSCRELVTFHDGFSAFAACFDLTIAAAIEEEEGSEVSAKQVKEICDFITAKHIPAIFVEKNGSVNAAEIISAETGVKIYTLNTMMDGESDYFTAMTENVNAIKEALS